MSLEEAKYDAFVKRMEETYPKMFSEPYGGFCIGEGWWHIIEALCANIQSHINWVNESRERLLKDNQYDNVIPDYVKQVKVQQVKEKFGGLRFYCQGGDAQVQGMISMAESIASRTCETCGDIGTRRTGGWVRTLCDKHEKERQEAIRKQELSES